MNSIQTLFVGRGTWDDLQDRLAEIVLTAYQQKRYTMPYDPVERVVNTVISYGEQEDVVRLWWKFILPNPLSSMRFIITDRLLQYFKGIREYKEARDVLNKLLGELTLLEEKAPEVLDGDGAGQASSTIQLVSARYSLDLASLYIGELENRNDAVALIDSLVREMPELNNEAYPLIFIVVAYWKSGHLGWKGLIEFVRPSADSLIEAEKKISPGIYNLQVLRDQPLDLPLLALCCILFRMSWEEHMRYDVFDLLGLKEEDVDRDPVLRKFRDEFASFDLGCEQAHLLTWTEDRSFKTLIQTCSRFIQ